MKMRRNCRLWWPMQLAPSELSSSNILFGWFISSSSTSIDIVVAFACSAASLLQFQSGLEGILHETDRNMPVILQDKSGFSLLGQCARGITSNGQSLSVGMKEFDQRRSSNCQSANGLETEDILADDCGSWTCGCHNLCGLSEKCWQASTRNSNRVLLIFDSDEHLGNKEIRWLPKLHHLHWNGQNLSNCDVHVLFYKTPSYGDHYYSQQIWNSSRQSESAFKKPNWVDELQQRQSLFDLDTVILAMNCAAAAEISLKRNLHSKFSKRSVSFLSLTWLLLAICIASVSTLFYIILQILYGLLNSGSQCWIYNVLEKIFGTAWVNIRIRCCQILYWPIKLQEHGTRSLTNVEYAEKAALEKHSDWSSLAVDVLLGSAIGCVWLMGVPAGFKLNTELAGALGILSLNAIQIWSTLGIFLGFIVIYVVKALAILGILFGATVPAALIIDLITLTTSHVSTLHWFISLLYSSQIQALAALWRLFRGRKWNPLRQRLDSYDYTVKQHIVGSLLFTLLLLLLPTTSVFYIFFTLINTNISFLTMLIEVSISVIHATPYIKIFLRLVTPRRFPCGIWFEIVSCPKIDPPYENSLQNEDASREKCSALVSFLHSNFLSIGEVVLPHYRDVFCGVSRSIVATSFRGVLAGKRIRSTLGTGIPSPMPWMFIPYKEYWLLCRDSILSCRPRQP